MAPAPITPQGLAVAGDTASFTDRGQTSQFTATLTLSNGTAQDQTRAALWSSSNPAVASVSTTGFVTSQSTGAAVISATFQGLSGTRTANVSIACQVNNTGRITFGNRSATATQSVVWDGATLGTLAPGQDSPVVTAAAGIAHSLSFLVTGTTRNACNTSNPILSQCSVQTITCTGG